MQSKRETGPQPRDSNADAHGHDGKRFIVRADENYMTVRDALNGS
jgi:hypothetical protein